MESTRKISFIHGKMIFRKDLDINEKWCLCLFMIELLTIL